MNYLHYCKNCLALIAVLAIAKYSHAQNNDWRKWSIDASGNGADGVHTGDINRDGLVDVVSG